MIESTNNKTVAKRERMTKPGVAHLIRRSIVEGVYQPGVCLPNGEELAREYQTSHVTVLRAVEQLRDEGFLYAKRGTGTFVTDYPPHLWECALVLPHRLIDSRYHQMLAEESEKWNQKLGSWRIRPLIGVDPNECNETYNELVDMVNHGMIAGLLFPDSVQFFVGTPVLDHPGIARACASTMGLQPGISTIEMNIDTFLERALVAVKADGRQRVAILAPQSMLRRGDEEQHRFLFDRILASGLKTEPHWIIQLSPLEQDAVRRITQLLLGQPESNRPDAIILMDDHMIESSTLGILEERGALARDLTVIAYSNFPDRPKSFVPVRRLGFDCHAFFSRLIEAIDTQRRTGKETHIILDPVFENELEVT